MILNFEIDDEVGERLDALCRKEDRSRRYLAKRLITDVINTLFEDDFSEGREEAQPEPREVA